MTMRAGYDDVVVTTPVTVPYMRYSIRGAHWFLAGALAGLLKHSGLGKDKIDGLCVSSFTLTPDSAVGLTQHLGMTLRWLDHIPMGGACGVVALRRAARAVQCGDATVIACIAGDTNHTELVPAQPWYVQPVCTRCRISIWLWRTECELCLHYRLLHAQVWG